MGAGDTDILILGHHHILNEYLTNTNAMNDEIKKIDNRFFVELGAVLQKLVDAVNNAPEELKKTDYFKGFEMAKKETEKFIKNE